MIGRLIQCLDEIEDNMTEISKASVEGFCMIILFFLVMFFFVFVF